MLACGKLLGKIMKSVKLMEFCCCLNGVIVCLVFHTYKYPLRGIQGHGSGANLAEVSTMRHTIPNQSHSSQSAKIQKVTLFLDAKDLMLIKMSEFRVGRFLYGLSYCSYVILKQHDSLFLSCLLYLKITKFIDLFTKNRL